MAIVTRARNTNDGVTRGLRGITIPPQLYIVTYETAAESSVDPALLLQTDPDGVSLGAQYKFSNYGAVCTGYRLGNPIGTNAHEVYALFEPLSINVTGWKWSLRGFLETRHILETVEEVEALQKIIGPIVYEPVTQQQATHFAETSIPGQVTYLRATAKRKPIGADVPKPGFSIYLSRSDFTSLSLTFAQVEAACGHLGAVNTEPFQGAFAIPGSVLFSEIIVDQKFGTDASDDGSSQTGIKFDVQLRFDVELQKFSPLKLFHTIENEDGDVAFVRVVGSGNKVTEEFRIIRPMDLNGVLTILTP